MKRRLAVSAFVLQVGHHGSQNATTSELLEAVTPRVAVIPVGKWTFGRTGGHFTTFAFGHRRGDVVDLLSQHMNRRRTPAKTVKVAARVVARARTTSLFTANTEKGIGAPCGTVMSPDPITEEVPRV